MKGDETASRQRWRYALGAALLAALALFSAWQSMRYYEVGKAVDRYRKFSTIAADSVSRLEVRLACLQPAIAPGERLGFYTPLEGDEYIEVYRWTQYALAPAIIIGTEVEGKSVAVLPQGQSVEETLADERVVLLDCGNGVGLITGRGAK